MISSIDLNGDVGEGADDANFIPLLSSANIACGGHAGDDSRMRLAVQRCLVAQVALGAHPSFPDREQFGRADVAASAQLVQEWVTQQMRKLCDIARAEGARLAHVKPHGALYNRATRDPETADAVASAIERLLPGIRLLAPPGSQLANAGRRHGLQIVEEGFADRGYDVDGMLLPRERAGAVIVEPGAVVAQALRLAGVTARVPRDDSDSSARQVPRVATICLHGDTPGAVELAKAVRRALEAAGVRISRPSLTPNSATAPATPPQPNDVPASFSKQSA